MTLLDDPLIDELRLQSRRLVRAWGFMGSRLAGTELSPSGVHAVLEIGTRPVTHARDLAELLRLEKSTISRLVAGLVKSGLIDEVAAQSDGRAKQLKLTESGERLFRQITKFARRQVRAAVSPLTPAQVRRVREGLTTYADSLWACSSKGQSDPLSEEIQIVPGYQPGLLGRIAELHGAFYHQHSGFGRSFEAKVAAEYAAFLERLDKTRNQTWAAKLGGEILGGVTVDGEDLGGNTAHLRWFIVDEVWHGLKVGNRLMDAAMAFVDQNQFSQTVLWTFKGLDPARRLYEKHGFQLAEERLGKQWHHEVMEQRFVRPG